MLQILGETQANVIATKASGTLETSDYEKLLPLMNKIAGEHKKIRWYFEMQDFEGWSAGGFWKDLKFDLGHADQFEKVAMVGDEEWEERITSLMKLFTPAEVKFFSLEQREQALVWIKSEQEQR